MNPQNFTLTPHNAAAITLESTPRGALASVHKILRFCDLCKELAFGTSTRK